MKRLWIWTLVLALALGCLAGCGGQKPKEDTPVDTSEPTLPTIGGSETEDDGTSEELQPVIPQVTMSSDGDIGMPPQEIVSSGDLVTTGEKMKVTLVVPDRFGDHGFADAAKDGLDQLKSEYGISTTTLECAGQGYAERLRTASENATVVVCVGSEFSVLHDVAPEFPKVRYIWVDGGRADPVDNVLQMAFAQNEGAYLAGYLAAASSESGKLGAVCAGNSVVVRDYLAGFRQGAAACRDGVQVLTEDIGANGDADAAYNAALSLSEQGADVIFQLAGTSGSGVFAAAQVCGARIIGAESDQKYLSDAGVLCSVVKKVDKAVHDTVLEAMRGRYESWGSVWTGMLGQGYVTLSYGENGATQLVSDELQARVDELTLRIASGEITVETVR